MEKNKCAHYSISHKKSYSIKDVAKMFKKQNYYLKKDQVKDMPQL